MSILFVFLGIACLGIVGLLTYTRGVSWFGRLPGDLRYEGRRSRVYAPLASMLLLSLILSLVVFLINALF